VRPKVRGCERVGVADLRRPEVDDPDNVGLGRLHHQVQEASIIVFERRPCLEQVSDHGIPFTGLGLSLFNSA
jgi:hypothetical protein